MEAVKIAAIFTAGVKGRVDIANPAKSCPNERVTADDEAREGREGRVITGV